MRNLFFVFLYCFVFIGYAQKIKGKVQNQITLAPISGALVYLANDSVSVVTDETGQFEFTAIKSGLYNIVVSHLGYITSLQKEVWARPGAVTSLVFNLEQASISLNEVQIKASTGWESLSSRMITEEQINRFAATYYDPARLVMASPDVAVTNDQNNRISVRGISPDYNTWRLEGAEILNPNHLSNAGTINDQPAGTGGGVNILSAQMLDRSSFQYGSMGSSIGNSIGGVFDMNLRTGQSESRRNVFQASFIGFDLGSEGSFRENGKATYLLNYRYSFTGLLTNLGVDFGGESIGFQDLSFVAHIPTVKKGSFKIFAIGGTSFNRFVHLPFAESMRDKDRQDIDFTGKMGLTGISYSKGKIQASVVASGFENERLQVNYNPTDNPDTAISNLFDQSLISANISSSHQLGRHTFKMGMMANFYSLSGDNMRLIRAYQENTFRISSKLNLDYGFAVIAGNFKQRAVDGRTALRYLINPQHELSISYGSYHQLLNETNQFFDNRLRPNEQLPENDQKMIKSKRLVLAYIRFFENSRLGFEFFDYFFPEVSHAKYNFSGSPESFKSQAHSYGISVKFDRDFIKGWYLNTGVTAFDAGLYRRRGFGESIYYYNTAYNLSGSIGKSIAIKNKLGERTFNANLRWMQQGPPMQSLTTITGPISDIRLPNFDISPLENLKHFMRLDIRLQYLNSGKRNTTWALDIQNVLNRQNEAFFYQDSFLGSRQTSYHLGLIPILTYRVEF